MVSETFGTKKSLHNQSQQNLVPKKSQKKFKLVPKKSWNQSQKYLASVLKLSGLETFPFDLFKPFVSFSHIYLTISCQNFGVSLGLGIGLVPFPGLLYFLDGIKKKLVLEKSRNRLQKNLVLKKVLELVSKKVLEPVSERIWYQKMSQNRSRQIFGSRQAHTHPFMCYRYFRLLQAELAL